MLVRREGEGVRSGAGARRGAGLSLGSVRREGAVVLEWRHAEGVDVEVRGIGVGCSLRSTALDRLLE